MKFNSRRSNNKHHNGSGIFISVDPESWWINGIYIAGRNEREAVIVQGALARIIKPGHWGWLRRLIGFKKSEL